MVGSAVWREFTKQGYTNLIGKSSREVDLRDQAAVLTFFETEKPDIIIDSAARVGGILANSESPYQFLIETLLIQNNLIDGAVKTVIEVYFFRQLVYLSKICRTTHS